MVPKGIILDCLCVLLGTNLGSAIKNHIPARINQPMNVIFGLSAIAHRHHLCGKAALSARRDPGLYSGRTDRGSCQFR